jgi:hypothetical protein
MRDRIKNENKMTRKIDPLIKKGFQALIFITEVKKYELL